MKRLTNTVRKFFSKKADIVVYRNGKAYKFKTMSEARVFASK